MSAPPPPLRELLSYLEGIGYGELYLSPARAPSAALETVPAETVPAETVPAETMPAETAAGEEPPAAELEELARRAAGCVACRLSEGRTQVVFGSGGAGSRLMLVGEGPGAEEDRRGEPFVGPAGQLLTRILAAIGLERGEVYITNMVKCRPPRNRDPQPDEIAACRPYLEAQIELVRPQVIVALGRVAAQALLATGESLSRLRGRWHMVQGVPARVTYHPAALLRYSHYKRPTWEDMQAVRDRLRES